MKNAVFNIHAYFAVYVAKNVVFSVRKIKHIKRRIWKMPERKIQV